MNYTINEKTAITKKIKSCSFLIFNLILFMTNSFNKSCSEVRLQIQMKKENNLRIFFSKTAFENENIRNIIIETITRKDRKQTFQGTLCLKKPLKLKRKTREEPFQYLSPTCSGPPAHY